MKRAVNLPFFSIRQDNYIAIRHQLTFSAKRDGFDVIKKQFNEVTPRKHLFNLRPLSCEKVFDVLAPQVAKSRPDHFGRRAEQNHAVEEISIFCHKNRSSTTSFEPNLVVSQASAELGRVKDLNGETSAA